MSVTIDIMLNVFSILFLISYFFYPAIVFTYLPYLIGFVLARQITGWIYFKKILFGVSLLRISTPFLYTMLRQGDRISHLLLNKKNGISIHENKGIFLRNIDFDEYLLRLRQLKGEDFAKKKGDELSLIGLSDIEDKCCILYRNQITYEEIPACMFLDSVKLV